MKYRRHTGGLKESLDTTVEVNSFLELVSEVYKSWPGMNAIKFEYQGADPRTGWGDTWEVHIITHFGWFPVGMSDGNNFREE